MGLSVLSWPCVLCWDCIATGCFVISISRWCYRNIVYNNGELKNNSAATDLNSSRLKNTKNPVSVYFSEY